MISTARLQLIFFMILTAGVSVIAFFIFKPYIAPIFLAAVLAIVFHPLYEKIRKFFGVNESVASLTTVVIILAAILIPSVFFGAAIFNESVVFYDYLSQQSDAGLFDNIVGFVEKKLPNIAQDESVYVGEYLKKSVSWFSDHFNTFFSGFFRILMGLFIMIVSLFYFLKDGARIVKRLVAVSPLADSYDEQIMRKIGLAVNSVVKGSLAIALIKGILTAVGFMIFSVPNPMLWGAVSALASLIPVVGSSLVIAPAVLYLYLSALYGNAIGLAVWGIILVGLSDNVLSPLLLKRGMKIHPFLILLSVIGGLGFFGPIGFIAGPIVLSFLFALFEIYPLITKKIINEKKIN